jgi:hypothetical protein
MATKTSHSQQPEAVHAGLNCMLCRISLSVSNSIGDIHIIGRMPRGAIPVDAIFYGGSAFTDASTGAIIKLGTSASTELFFASDTYSTNQDTALRCTRQLGTARQISLSDESMPRYDNVVFVASDAGVSIGHIGDLIALYVMPGNTF